MTLKKIFVIRLPSISHSSVNIEDLLLSEKEIKNKSKNKESILLFMCFY